MPMQASSSRPAAKSVGAAFVDVVLTLVILVVALLAFLIAPLVALALAYLGYAVMRPRARRTRPAAAGQPDQGTEAAAHGFGAGTSA